MPYARASAERSLQPCTLRRGQGRTGQSARSLSGASRAHARLGLAKGGALYGTLSLRSTLYPDRRPQALCFNDNVE